MRSLYAALAAFLRALVLTRATLSFENAALRQQIAVLQHSARRPRLRPSDRIFWVLLSWLWSRWRSVLVIVQPRTVLAWHREGWRLFWKWKSQGGRPAIEREHRELIRRLSLDNPAKRWLTRIMGLTASFRAYTLRPQRTESSESRKTDAARGRDEVFADDGGLPAARRSAPLEKCPTFFPDFRDPLEALVAVFSQNSCTGRFGIEHDAPRKVVRETNWRVPRGSNLVSRQNRLARHW